MNFSKAAGPAAMNVTEAAKALGVSRGTIYTLRARGDLGFSRIAGKTVVLRSELDRFVGTLAAAAEDERAAVRGRAS
jgi:excisionase family DNA binding protein